MLKLNFEKADGLGKSYLQIKGGLISEGIFNFISNLPITIKLYSRYEEPYPLFI